MISKLIKQWLCELTWWLACKVDRDLEALLEDLVAEHPDKLSVYVRRRLQSTNVYGRPTANRQVIKVVLGCYSDSTCEHLLEHVKTWQRRGVFYGPGSVSEAVHKRLNGIKIANERFRLRLRQGRA